MSEVKVPRGISPYEGQKFRGGWRKLLNEDAKVTLPILLRTLFGKQSKEII
jgi:hypothetical protein